MSRLRFFLLFVLVLLLLFYWNEPYLLPFKLFVVFIHESCHAVAAYLLGAEVKGIVLHLNESGVTEAEAVLNNSFILMVSAGYLGSTFIGAYLLNRGLKGKWISATFYILGISLMAISIKLALSNDNTNEDSFLTAIFGLSCGLFLLFAGFFGKRFGQLFLTALGVLSTMYCLFDFGDFIRGVENTDAGILAKYLQSKFIQDGSADKLQILAYMVVFIWGIITILILIVFLKDALKKEKIKEKKIAFISKKQYPNNDFSFPVQYSPGATQNLNNLQVSGNATPEIGTGNQQ